MPFHLSSGAATLICTGFESASVSAMFHIQVGSWPGFNPPVLPM
ncbi:hypothetical protein [Actinokineospora sp.]